MPVGHDDNDNDHYVDGDEEDEAEPLVEDLVEVDLARLLQVFDHHRPDHH